MSAPDLSIVVPCYRSAPWLPELVERIKASTSQFGAVEILLVNDASGDDTWKVIRELAQQHDEVRGFDLSFNTGQYRATVCGFEQARADLIVTLDDDLQHPPEDIPALVVPLTNDEDCDAVFGSFTVKRHNPLRNLGTAIMSRLFNVFYNKPSHIQATSFRALRRSLVGSICRHGTANPNINALIFLTTDRIASFEVNHQARQKGRSGYRLTRLVRLMLDNILSVSTLPLKCVSVLGLLSAAASLALGVFYLVQYWSGQIKEPGFPTLVLLIIFFGGLTLFSIGLLGEYIIRIMEEVRHRPRYIVRQDTDDVPSDTPPPF